jgi:SNF family Na+-dependent transporter
MSNLITLLGLMVSEGVGLASIIGSVIVGTYYNMIIAWTLFYFVHSLLGEGWKRCDNVFNTPSKKVLGKRKSFSFKLNACTNISLLPHHHIDCTTLAEQINNRTNENHENLVSSTEEFFK